MNQPLLAKALGINNSMISSYITGKCTPSYDTFVMFVEFFHCSADFLLGLKEYPCEEIAYKPVQPFCERLRAVHKRTLCFGQRFCGANVKSPSSCVRRSRTAAVCITHTFAPRGKPLLSIYGASKTTLLRLLL